MAIYFTSNIGGLDECIHVFSNIKAETLLNDAITDKVILQIKPFSKLLMHSSFSENIDILNEDIIKLINESEKNGYIWRIHDDNGDLICQKHPSESTINWSNTKKNLTIWQSNLISLVRSNLT